LEILPLLIASAVIHQALQSLLRHITLLIKQEEWAQLLCMQA